MSSDNQTNYRDMDFLLKERFVLEIIPLACADYTNNNYEKSYKGFKMMFMALSGDEFSNKKNLQEIGELLDRYFLDITGRSTTMKERINYNSKVFEVKRLLDMFINYVFRTLKEKGLWFKETTVYSDLDEWLSNENFGDEKSLLNHKIKELKNLEKDELFELISKRQIHDIYARWLFENAV